MLTSWRSLAVAAFAVLSLSCARRPTPRPISAEAAALFGRAEVEGMGGSLVLDAEVLRELGFRPGEQRAEGGEAAVDLAVGLLPAMAAELKDAPSGPMLARAAVLLALAREWAIAPRVQRLGVIVQVDALRPDRYADNALVLLAVREGEKENRELLQALGAAVRSTAGRELVAAQGGDLCVAREAVPELPFQVCIRPGPGYLALGTAQALAALATPPPGPGSRESGPLLRLLVKLPGQGKAELTMEGHGALRVAGVVEPEDPRLAGKVEEGIQELLRTADAQREKGRAVMAAALGQVQASVAGDPAAPARMKAAVAGATVEKLLDPRGEYAALRSSMKVARTGTRVTAELTIPEAQVRRAARLDPGMLTTVAAVGVLSAIAIPNFVRYQCRAKQAEAAASLRQTWVSLEEYRSVHGAYPKRLDELGPPGPGPLRYTLCTRAGCLAPGEPRAAAACREALEGAGGAGESPVVCAAAELSGTTDVWLIGGEGPGEVSAFRDACR